MDRKTVRRGMAAFIAFSVMGVPAFADAPGGDLDPSAGVLFRVFKQARGADPDYKGPGTMVEPAGVRANSNVGSLEAWVWSRSENRYKLYKTFPVTAYTGNIGPKLREGDHQGPEGFYSIDALKGSRYGGKAFLLNYPNAHDRSQKPAWTGNYIEIHGGAKSDGCFALGGKIGEVYELADKAAKGGQEEIPVQVFPFPMTSSNMQKVRGHRWLPFWNQLKAGYDAFEATHLPPRFHVDPVTRSYHFERVTEPQASPRKEVCSEAWKPYFGDERDSSQIKTYLRVQGQLALQRLIWAHLKTQGAKTEEIEKKLELLTMERNPKLHESFVKSSIPLENLERLEELRSLLKEGDLKIISLLMSAEKTYGSGARGGVVDVIKLIQEKNTRPEEFEKVLHLFAPEAGRISRGVENILVERSCTRTAARASLPCAEAASHYEFSEISGLVSEIGSVEDRLKLDHEIAF